ncbi:MAG: DUF1616 domain-containing protein [Candidatus Methanomethylicia archaeon]
MAKRNSSTETVELDRISREILKLISRRSELTISEVIDIIAGMLRVKKYEVARKLYRLREANLIRFIDPSPPGTILKFLFSLRSFWYWLLVATVISTNIVIHIPLLTYARYVLGSLFVLYLPGASLIELLYPKREHISQLERLALSIGLSLALTPLVGLILNYTPWGIRLNPIVASLTILTITLSTGALIRKYTYFKLEMLGGR